MTECQRQPDTSRRTKLHGVCPVPGSFNSDIAGRSALSSVTLYCIPLTVPHTTKVHTNTRTHRDKAIAQQDCTWTETYCQNRFSMRRALCTRAVALLALCAASQAGAAPAATTHKDVYEESLSGEAVNADGGSRLVTWEAAFHAADSGPWLHVHSLPPHVLHTTHEAGAEEWLFTMRSGRWALDDDAAAAPDVAVPAEGATLAAWFPAAWDAGRVRQAWERLGLALGGMFGVSLTDDAAAPAMVRTAALQTAGGGVGVAMRRMPDAGGGTMLTFRPREVLCVDHVARWLKQLPCRSAAGVASLVSSVAVCQAPYRDMSVRVWRQGGRVRLRYTLRVLMDDAAADAVLQAPYTACPVAGRTNASDAALAAQPPPAIVLSRWLSTDGGLAVRTQFVRLRNTLTHTAVTGSYVELHPLYTTPLLHSYMLTTLGRAADGGGRHVVAEVPLFSSPLATLQGYADTPDAAGRNATCRVLSVRLTVPPGTELVVSGTFRTALLNAAAYPPDPHRGMDLPPVMWSEPGGNAVSFSNSPLLELPAPDFSMPYNVITLVSTALSFFVGTMSNVLSRQPRGARKRSKASTPPPSPLPSTPSPASPTPPPQK